MLLGCLAVLSLGACQQDELVSMPQGVLPGHELTLTFSSNPMDRYQVTTRSSDPKDDEEKRINTLYIFFFGPDGQWLTGSYLTGYQGATGAIDEGGYISPTQGATLLKIDRDGFTDTTAATGATVYAVANVESALFRELDDYGRPQVLQDSIDTGRYATPLQALQSLVYKPEQFFCTTLPDTGMPMAGSSNAIDLTGQTGTAEERIIELTALMARIDVSLQIESDISQGHLPSMLLTSWTARNLPAQVCFTPTAAGETTPVTEKADFTDPAIEYIYNRQGSIDFSFYMFENMQQPTGEARYPESIEEYQKQRYKPTIAGDDATCIEFNSEYTTYNNHTYTVRYTLYLGSNHTDNFEVQRNHQYKNNITIKGLTAHKTNNTGDDLTGEYTYDARVNIEETGNKYYISILRERNHDAHFCVTPMDVYFFDEGANPKMDICFLNNSDLDADGRPWIRMEKIVAADMEQGTVTNSGFTAYSDPNGTGTHLATGTAWTAGNGKRAFFTTNLVTKTLAETGATATVEKSRDRIYFYIDENLSDSQYRTATVQLTYTDDSGSRTRTLAITQTHFLKVQVYNRNGDKADTNRPYSDNNSYDAEDGVIYMEQYEEYLDHYDPLDKHATDQIYTGLEWGCSGMSVSYAENYAEGLYYTGAIVDVVGQTVMALNDVPRSAAEYCYNRNKREPNGAVHHERTYWGLIPVGYDTKRKYFLPGIRQMEDALNQYYGTFKEFQENFYWSSAAGKEGILGRANDRARATKINSDGTYVESDRNDNYPDGGNALRTEKLRIRAFRSDLERVE